MYKQREVICPKCLKSRKLYCSIKIKEKLCMSCAKSVDLNIINYFDIIDNSHKAYIFGFLWADAWINRHFLRVELQAKDLDFLEFLKKELGKGQILYRERINKRFKKESESYTYQIGSTYL